MAGIIDTHAHITYDKLYGRLEEVVENAKNSDIEKILCICTNPIEYERALKIKNEMIDLAYGFNPQDIEDIDESYFDSLKQAISNKTIVAIGEIGLDYYWVNDNKEAQYELFITQIKMANEAGLPILIHMRNATNDTLMILKEYCKTVFLLHCFSGSVETAKIALKMGGYISFAGPITFKNAKGLLDVVPVVDDDHIFVETDCPFLAPHPFRGKENEPAFVKYTFEKVCELKGMDAEILKEKMMNNYKRLFYRE